jgi:hypothetical protein
MAKLPTRWKLAAALIAAGLYDMADKAVSGYYDDFMSPLDAPIFALVADLKKIGTPDALLVAEQAIEGDFDGTAAEGEAWAASPEGVAAFKMLHQGKT